MLTALDKNGQLINLLEKSVKKGSFFCPACKTPVYFKNGPIKMPHFAHASLKSCHSWSENESIQHLSLKKILYQWFSRTEKVEVEKYLPQLEQTPDLLVNDRIAIEIQCSSLSLTRLHERTENYRVHGYYVIWLMGRDLWLKEQLTALQKNLMYFSKNRGFYFWELDLEKRELRLKSMLHENLRGKITFVEENFPFEQENLLTLLRSPYHSQSLVCLKTKQDHLLKHFIQNQLYHRTAKWLKIQEKFYQNGENLLTQNFDKAYFSPIGLNLLTFKFDRMVKNDFCQIPQDLTAYYQKFYQNFWETESERLYPPRFYDIMKTKIRQEEE